MSSQQAPTVTEYFSVDDLHHVRVLVERACAAVGMAGERIYRLVFAVNEIAINAVKHAGGWGVLTVRQSRHGVSVEVSDRGPGLPEALPTERPSVTATETPRPAATWPPSVGQTRLTGSQRESVRSRSFGLTGLGR